MGSQCRVAGSRHLRLASIGDCGRMGRHLRLTFSVRWRLLQLSACGARGLRLTTKIARLQCRQQLSQATRWFSHTIRAEAHRRRDSHPNPEKERPMSDQSTTSSGTVTEMCWVLQNEDGSYRGTIHVYDSRNCPGRRALAERFPATEYVLRARADLPAGMPKCRHRSCHRCGPQGSRRPFAYLSKRPPKPDADRRARIDALRAERRPTGTSMFPELDAAQR